MKYNSIWKNNSDKKFLDKLPNNYKTDILIIGGGITGITSAFFLKDKGFNVTLIDKGSLCCGVTAKTTAKITYLQDDIYYRLEKNHGIKVAYKYYKSQKEAVSLIKRNIVDNKIDCDFLETPSIVFTRKNSNKYKIERERLLLEKWGEKTNNINYKKIKDGFKVNNTYTFNPLKYLNGLINEIENKVTIYENVTAKNIVNLNNEFKIETNQGNIIAKKVIVACHYPFFIIPGFIPLKTYIKREYVNAAKVSNIYNFAAVNIDKDLYSLRFYKDYLIYGSNNHKLTNKIDYSKNYDKSIKDFKKEFKINSEVIWMNQDVMSNDDLPFIGKLKDNLYLATAYNAWGMTNGTIAAKIITDLIMYKNNEYIELFKPIRMNKTLFTKSLLNSFSYLKVYIESLFYKSNPYYIKINGLIYGVYVDKNKKKHYVKLICPHMKCNLVFNKAEKTWDCPCHGSRFDIDGKLIEGPAKDNLKDNDE